MSLTLSLVMLASFSAGSAGATSLATLKAQARAVSSGSPC